MFDKHLFLFAVLLIGLQASAQTVSPSDQSRMYVYLYEQLTKENSLKLNRITRQGDLSACELEFQYVYRDTRARNGAPIVLTGSFSASWSPGRIPGYMYKINAYEFDFVATKWNVSAPPYINIVVKGQTFHKHKNIDFVCESGGRCVGYSDESFRINLAVLQAVPFDATLSWSLVEGGMDNSVNLSNIGDRSSATKALESFFRCNMEINDKLTEYLKKYSK
jgi:hypothetical protein